MLALEGQAKEGLWISSTVTCCTQLLLLPAASVAVHCTWLVPVSKSNVLLEEVNVPLRLLSGFWTK